MWSTIRIVAGIVSLAVWVGAVWTAGAAEPLYQNNFEESEIGKVPDEFLVIDGQFAVRELEGNRFLELPGAPLESFGFLMGPARKEGLAVSARIQGTSRGRKFPTFAVSANGVGGYRLRVAPAKKSIEIVKGDVPLVDAPFAWKSGTWTWLRLQVRKVGDGIWRVEGKAWLEGEAEPEGWMISLEEKQEPVPGRPGAWGSPFSGTPIWFDNLRVNVADETQ
jgi:hypothetical protein